MFRVTRDRTLSHETTAPIPTGTAWWVCPWVLESSRIFQLLLQGLTGHPFTDPYPGQTEQRKLPLLLCLVILEIGADCGVAQEGNWARVTVTQDTQPVLCRVLAASPAQDLMKLEKHRV